MEEITFDEEETLGSEEECYKCNEEPVIALKQMQEWEYRDEDKETDQQKMKLFLCKEHHNLMIETGAQML